MLKHTPTGDAPDTVSDGVHDNGRRVHNHAQITQQGFRQIISQVAPPDKVRKWTFGGYVSSRIVIAIVHSRIGHT